MSAAALLFAAAFAWWAWTAVGAMLSIRRRGLALRQGWRDGPASEWRGLADWWRDGAEAPRRRRLAALSATLLAVVLAFEALEP